MVDYLTEEKIDSDTNSKTQGIPLHSYLKASNAVGAIFSSSVICGLLGVMTTVILTSSLGLGRITDSYFMAFAILLGFVKLFREGTFQTIYISLFSPLVKKNQKDVLREMVTNFHSLSVIFFGLVGILLLLVAPWLVRLMAPGFDAVAQNHTVVMVRFLFFTVLYWALTGILVAVYHSYQRFSFPALMQIAPSFISFFVALFFLKRMGIYSLIWAFLIGAIIYLILLYMNLPLKGLKFNLKANIKNPEVKKMGKLLFPFYLSDVALQGFLWVQNVLSSLIGPGAVSMLVLARKIRDYFLEYILRPFPRVIYPSLIKSIEDKPALKNLTLKAITMSNFVILPPVIWLVALGYQFVRLIFQHGSFSADTANNLAGFLTAFSLSLLIQGTDPSLTQILYARQRTDWINIIRFIGKTINIILSLVFFKFLGFLGLAWAVVVGNWSEFIMSCFFANKIIKLKPIFTDHSFVKIIFNAGFLFLVTFIFNGFLSIYLKGTAIWQQGLQIILVISISGLVYILLAHLLKIEELEIIYSLIKLKLRKVREIFPGVA